MLWWLFVLALFYASARWAAVGVVVRFTFLAFGIVVLVMLLRIGYVSALIGAMFEIPLLFLQAIFGLVVAVLSP